MDREEQKFREVEQIINQSGYTLSDFIMHSSRYNSKLLMMPEQYLRQFSELYDSIDEGGLSRRDKGKRLEELSELLFKKSVKNMFDVYKNCRTSTNEIDLLIRWTEKAILAGISNSFHFMGETFLCECKNYDGLKKNGIDPRKIFANLYIGDDCCDLKEFNLPFGGWK